MYTPQNGDKVAIPALAEIGYVERAYNHGAIVVFTEAAGTADVPFHMLAPIKYENGDVVRILSWHSRDAEDDTYGEIVDVEWRDADDFADDDFEGTWYAVAVDGDDDSSHCWLSEDDLAPMGELIPDSFSS